MRTLRRIVAGVVIAALLAALALVGILYVQARRQPPAGTPAYVALGSSFAAGIGLGARTAGSPWVCLHGTGGYPPMVARALRLPLIDMSCSGATTAHVVRGGQVFLGPQLAAVTAATRLVTITSGGNDIGYVGDLATLAGSRSPGFAGFVARRFRGDLLPAGARDFGRVRADLLATLRIVRQRAPRARVVVLSYPQIMPRRGNCPQLQLTDAEVALMRGVGDRLAAVTAAAAQAGGAAFVDMQRLGAAHDACSAHPWVNPWRDAASTQFHPTAAGARAMAAATLRALAPPPPAAPDRAARR